MYQFIHVFVLINHKVLITQVSTFDSLHFTIEGTFNKKYLIVRYEKSMYTSSFKCKRIKIENSM